MGVMVGFIWAFGIVGRRSARQMVIPVPSTGLRRQCLATSG